MENGAFSGINDFVISFEHPCYFSKLVKRVSELFITKSWIDHIAWGHGNTLVGGILVCINLHTSSLPNTGTIRPKTNQLCQIYVVFVFLNMQVRKWKKWTKITRKQRNRAREWKRNQKPRPGSIFQVRINIWAQSAKPILEDLSVVIFSPWNYFTKMAEVVL